MNDNNSGFSGYKKFFTALFLLVSFSLLSGIVKVSWLKLLAPKTGQIPGEIFVLNPTASLKLSPVNFSKNETDNPFTVNVQVFPGGQGVVGADIKINFDKSKLELVDIIPNTTNVFKTFMPVTSQGFSDFDKDSVITNANTSGNLVFGILAVDPADLSSGGGASILTPFTGNNLILAGLSFKVKSGAAAGVSDITISYASGGGNANSFVYALENNQPQDILGSVVSASVNISTCQVPGVPAVTLDLTSGTGACTIDDTPTWNWTVNNNGGCAITDYKIDRSWIDGNSDGNNLDPNGDTNYNSNITSFTPTDLVGKTGAYSLRVRAKNAKGWGNWSAIKKVNMDTSLPSVPVLNNPADGLIVTSKTPTFTTTVSSDQGCGNNSIKYKFQVDDSNNFSAPLVRNPDWTANTSWTTSALSSGTYYWRVKSRDGIGNTSGWSEIRSIIIADCDASSQSSCTNDITRKYCQNNQWATQDCSSSDKYCSSGQCTDYTCNANQIRCSGNTPQACSADRKSWSASTNLTVCGAGKQCSSGTCVDIPNYCGTNGENRCTANGRETCTNNTWTANACSTGKECTGVGQCTNIPGWCTPNGASQCLTDGSRQVCVSNTWQNQNCSDDKYCTSIGCRKNVCQAYDFDNSDQIDATDLISVINNWTGNSFDLIQVITNWGPCY